MNKYILLLSLLSVCLVALEIPQEQTSKRTFSSSVPMNSKIIQLSNSYQSLMSLVSGHIEHYYVKAGQRIKAGQKVVGIESIHLSKMTAEYIAQKKQLKSLDNNYQAVKSLYEKGMASLQTLNIQSIQKEELLATINALELQLSILGVDTKNLTKATSSYTLFAHSDGVVSRIIQPLHSGIQEDTPIISLVKEQAYYIESYLPLAYASKVKIGQKITINVNGKTIVSYITQILPKLDEKTQRIVLLSSINEVNNTLYINTFIESKLYFSDIKKHVAVKKTALTFFNNDWVVFIPKEVENHDKLEKNHETKDEDKHQGHDHAEHEEEEAQYEIRVVEVMAQDGEYVAVKGLEEGEMYVSDKSYYVKSMLLKSALGGHGH